jgi:cytochrome c553
VLLAAAAGTSYAVSEMHLREHYTVPTTQIPIPNDPISIERGRHIATALAKCVDCHGQDFGGKIVIDDPAVGLLAGPNLTSGAGGRAPMLHDSDWVRAIRHGIDHTGRPLAMMPSDEFWHYDDEEVGALVAFLKSVPPVNRTMPEISVGPIIRLLNTIGEVKLAAQKIDHTAERPPTPPAAETAEYGAHLVKTGGCTGCHGPSLSGGKIPGAPPDWIPSRNLTPHATGLASWTEQDFMRALRTGIRPDGSAINGKYMPWKATRLMSDLEIRALWKYLRTVEPREAGNR